jgi:putative hemolysin
MEIVILILLILFNGIFSMSEMALVSARKSRLEAQAKAGDTRARVALGLAEAPNRFLSTVQVGITVIGILTGIYSGASLTEPLQRVLEGIRVLQPYAHPLAVGVVVVVITYLSVVVGELLPKQIGLTHPEGIAKAMAGPMNGLSRLVTPFIWLLTASSDFFIRLFRIQAAEGSQVTEEEIKSLLEEGASEGAIEEIEHDIVKNVFGLGDRRIAALMSNRLEIIWLDVEAGVESNLQKVLTHKHSAYPVCKGSIDQVVGILYTKDLLAENLRAQLSQLNALKREPLFLAENSKVYFVLEKFRQTGTYHGIVVDEYGGVSGLITINDIFNALVGDGATSQELEQLIISRSDGSFLVDAGMDFDEFADFFSLTEFHLKELGEASRRDFQTVGGLVLHILHDIPQTGESMTWQGLRFEVVDMDKSRIDKLLVQRILPDAPSGKGHLPY